MAAQKNIIKKNKYHKLKYKINFVQVISKMKHKIIHLILHAGTDIKQLIKQTIDYIDKTTKAVRKKLVLRPA